jgi:hypothetical protein
MVRKVKLKLEELDVVSFHVGDGTTAQGTVHAQSAQEYEDSEASACTCTTGGTAFFTWGCEGATWVTAHWKAC